MEDEKWCPKAAMNAYLCTLRLCKDASTTGAEGDDKSRSAVVEPECMEFISALAAGNGAQLIVEIASENTPLTLALAIAAKQTGGRFVCILPTHYCHVQSSQSHFSINYPDLEDTIKFVSGDPCEKMMEFDPHIDFVVINDTQFDEHIRLLEVLMSRKSKEANGRASVVVEMLGRLSTSTASRGIIRGMSFGEVVREREGVESVSLPVSGGMELTRIKNGRKISCKAAAAASCGEVRSERRRCKRFHVTVENR